jgi:hypothetical protein
MGDDKRASLRRTGSSASCEPNVLKNFGRDTLGWAEAFVSEPSPSHCSDALYQGTTSVGPERLNKNPGFSPLGRRIQAAEKLVSLKDTAFRPYITAM